jgi:OOP family OmpA-OmpF porin
MKIVKYTALVAVLLAAAPALAQNKGPYLGISAGYARTDIDTGEINDEARSAGFATASTSADESDTAWKVFAGFQFNRNFALELGYSDLGESSIRTRTTGPAATVNGEFKAKAWSLDAVGTLPLNDRFSLLARAGAIYYDLDARSAAVAGGVPIKVRDSDKDLSWKAGLGAQYSLTNNLGARLEWEHYHRLGDEDTGKSSVDTFSLGLQFRF